MRSFTIDTRMFSQPGFEILYDAWSSAFEMDDEGVSVLPAHEALQRTRDARSEVATIAGLDKHTLDTPESIACRYAQVMPVFVEERVYA